ncbi:hypothetical protein [Paraburkholderia youngii]|uniref:Uncharacterized protein n=1 Tax=Paraburkholderia youngii TaxID=2782701 RepID=A0A7W8LDF8_9BURK|nr:hypothetical protein [Paraburkholderia youngii]MBB5404643.1 hypothetical protein [Paraburkholderia youngii]
MNDCSAPSVSEKTFNGIRRTQHNRTVNRTWRSVAAASFEKWIARLVSKNGMNAEAECSQPGGARGAKRVHRIRLNPHGWDLDRMRVDEMRNEVMRCQSARQLIVHGEAERG